MDLTLAVIFLLNATRNLIICVGNENIPPGSCGIRMTSSIFVVWQKINEISHLKFQKAKRIVLKKNLSFPWSDYETCLWLWRIFLLQGKFMKT